MWILLKEGDVIREGDESWYSLRDTWCPISHALSVSGKGIVTRWDAPIRRNVTGWEAVKYALEQEVLGTQDPHWDCDCGGEHENADGHIPVICSECDVPEIANRRKAEVILKIIDETI